MDQMQLHDHKAKMIKNTIDQQHIFDINIENILLKAILFQMTTVLILNSSIIQYWQLFTLKVTSVWLIVWLIDVKWKLCQPCLWREKVYKQISCSYKMAHRWADERQPRLLQERGSYSVVSEHIALFVAATNYFKFTKDT